MNWLTFFSFRSFTQTCMEAMQKVDFKIGQLRLNLVQMSLSPLAAWPILLLLVIFYFDPTRTTWTLQGVLTKNVSETNVIGFWLLDSSITHLLLVGFMFFLLEWLFRIEYGLISVILFLQAHADLHLLLSVAALFGLYLAQTSYLWWFYVELKSQTRRLWSRFCLTLYLGLLTSLVVILFGYIYFKQNGYFSFSIYVNRYEFLGLSLVIIYGLRLVFLLIWGHFTYQKIQNQPLNPDELAISYSTVTWILRYRMSSSLKNILLQQTEKRLKEYNDQIVQLNDLKDQSPVLLPFDLQKSFNEQHEYLKLASQRLTVQD